MTDIINFPIFPNQPTEVNPDEEDDMPLSPAAVLLYEASVLIDGDRDAQHGDRHENFSNIARAFSARLGKMVTPAEAALLLADMKMARTKSGSYNPDDYRDAAAYVALAGELALPK